MKSKITEIEQSKKFKPFKLEIEVQNENQLRYLWNIFNWSAETVQNRSVDKRIKIPSTRGIDSSLVWTVLDHTCNKLGLKS